MALAPLPRRPAAAAEAPAPEAAGAAARGRDPAESRGRRARRKPPPPHPRSQASPPRRPHDQAPVAAAPAPSGHAATVQLAALTSEEAARGEWQALTKRLPDLLGGRQPSYSRTEHDGHTFWRVRTSGFSDAAQARGFCEKVRAKGLGCSVTELARAGRQSRHRRYRRTALLAEEAALFRALPPAGIILFARNIQDPDQLARLTAALRAVLPADADMMVDQEGGRVARLRPPHWRAHPPAAALGRLFESRPGAALRAAWLTGALIGIDCRAAGFTVAAAPVLDLSHPRRA